MMLDTTRLLSTLPLSLVAHVPDLLVVEDDGDGAVPAELREWLLRLRLLDGVPFAHLVADTALLPEESIRWFYLDRRWTDALVQGALAVGTLNTDDRAQLTARYPSVRAELDQEERNLRRRPGSPRLRGGSGPVSGFLLRSAAVSGWPGIHVRAFRVDPAQGDDAAFPEGDPQRMRVLRLDRLAPAVLLCLFDGIPQVVHVEEPRQGVQFGFTPAGDGAAQRATLAPRDTTTSQDLNVPPVDVPFRTGGASGVVDIQALERALATVAGAGAADGLTSAEYALHLIRFPFRQVFGDVEERLVSSVFTPTVSYQVLADALFSTRGR